jgi:hypothetical protein
MRDLKLYIFLLLGLVQLSLNGQPVNTLYFMRDIPIRHYLNPAFQPTNDFYISAPIIGFTQFDLGNNSLSLKDVIYKSNGQTVSFLSSFGDIDRFYNRLKTNTIFSTNIQTNLLSLGFRHKLSYFTFSLSERLDGTVSVPKDLINLTLYGTPNMLANSFSFTNLQSDISLYTEVAFGYSKILNSKWTVGGKLKFLLGAANVSVTNSEMDLRAGADYWTLQGSGAVNMSSPFRTSIGPDFQTFSLNTPSTFSEWLKPSGVGVAIDLGSDYKLNNSIRLSAALTDFGFVNWKSNVQNYNYAVNFAFKGLKQFDSNVTVLDFRNFYNQLNNNILLDSISKAFRSSVNSNLSTHTYTTGTTAKLNLGFEYSFLNDRLSVGFLSNSRFSGVTINQEFTTSLNARPKDWFNATLSYSVLHGRFGSIGAGVGVRTGILHWFAAADYFAIQKITRNTSNFTYSIPYNTTYMNFSAGVNVVLDSEMNKLVRKKIDNARKYGLKNNNQNYTPKSVKILPDSKKISKNRFRIRWNGLIRKKTKEDCHCEPN